MYESMAGRAERPQAGGTSRYNRTSYVRQTGQQDAARPDASRSQEGSPAPVKPVKPGKRFSATEHVNRSAARAERIGNVTARIGRAAATGTRIASAEHMPTIHHRSAKRRSLSPALIAAAVCVVLLAGGLSWFFLFRNINVSVNGETVAVRVGTPLPAFLEEHDNFGATPGRLLSVGGNVLEEKGGEPYALTNHGEALTQEQIAQATVREGDELAIANGADVEEASTKETMEVAPGITRETGGAVQYVSQWGKPGKKVTKTGEVSGEVAEEVTEEPVDMVVSSINLSPDGGPYIALTFDDGPSGYTPEVLEILKEKGIHATFYNLGSQAKNYPDTCKAILDGGHELASHTMTHQNLPEADRETLRSEITKAADAIEAASGSRPQMIRAPYGAFGDTEWARAGDLISCNVLWNIDTEDWRLPGSDAIRAATVNNAFNGAIVLMHDGGGNREQTVAALPAIIDDLKAQGYEFVTVGELIRLDGRVPEDVPAGTVSMPKDAELPNV